MTEAAERTRRKSGREEMEGVHLFGIRHHGPGSARSLERALERLSPNVVLIEGPPDANELIALAADEAMRPPVALLVYRPDAPRRAVYYPFAEFSPEWRAMRYALGRGIPVRFVDLPQAHQLATEDEPDEQHVAGDADTTEPPNDASVVAPTPMIRQDPLGWLARTAGYEDGERFWEQLVEHRRNDDEALFAGVASVMAELRAESDAESVTREPETSALGRAAERERRREMQREAHMRRAIRDAQREGHARIAVVCGAWHVPALGTMPPAAHDAAILKGLPKARVEATWVPWTNDRLCAASGYGAGIESPGWYQHLWSVPDRVSERWLARVAALLREEDLDASPAQIIDAARLADGLAALRGRSLAGLRELTEATQSVLCTGGDAPLRLIGRKLVVGEALGDVPPTAPTVPLHQDLMREQRRLRLKPEAVERTLDLDLRQDTDLARSRLLHRLTLLGIPWGRAQRAAGQRGTFHELWTLQWQPELAVGLIEAAAWGNTIASAASARASDLAQHATDVPTLTALLSQVVLADVADAIEPLMARLQDESARAPDVAHLMDGLPALANALRYSDVRRTELGVVGPVVDGFVVRICVGLATACQSLDDDAATAMRERIEAVHGAVALLQRDDHTGAWQGALRRVADSDVVHGLVAGRATRLLFDAGVLDTGDAARRLSRSLSVAEEPARAAGWIEGFLAGSGQLLLHDDALWRLVDAWLVGLPEGTFVTMLPLLRRTFASFAAPERRQLGERARYVGRATKSPSTGVVDFDRERAERGLGTVLVLLGARPPAPTIDGMDSR